MILWMFFLVSLSIISFFSEKETTEVAISNAITSVPNQCTTDTPCVCEQNGNDKQGKRSLSLLSPPHLHVYVAVSRTSQ